MREAKKVICYLRGIIYLRLVYGAQSKHEGKIKALIAVFLYALVRYGDSSYIRDPEDRKLVMKYCYFINQIIASWYSKK